MDKYFTSMEQGGISALKTHLRNSQAKWDETAFAGAGYGIDDTNVPSTSAPTSKTSYDNTTDSGPFQHLILTMLQVMRTTRIATSIAEHPHARLHERVSPRHKLKPAMRPYKVSTTNAPGALHQQY
jgi:hypothetical protein